MPNTKSEFTALVSWFLHSSKWGHATERKSPDWQ